MISPTYVPNLRCIWTMPWWCCTTIFSKIETFLHQILWIYIPKSGPALVCFHYCHVCVIPQFLELRNLGVKILKVGSLALNHCILCSVGWYWCLVVELTIKFEGWYAIWRNLLRFLLHPVPFTDSNHSQVLWVDMGCWTSVFWVLEISLPESDESEDENWWIHLGSNT